MSNPLEQQPTFDQQVTHFKDAIANHQNITCEFNALPRDEQLKMARALSAGHLPDVNIKYEATNGSGLVVTLDQRNADGTCTAPEQKKDQSYNAYDAEELANARVWNGIEKEQRPRLQAEAAADYQKAHDPARLAKAIEDAAARDLKDDQSAKLEVRVRIEALNNETPEVKQQVLDHLQNDGAKWDPRNPVPKAEIRMGKDGEGEIVFNSAYAWHGADTVSLTKSVAQQAKEAEENYYTKTLPKAGITMAGPLAMHEEAKRNGTLTEDKKLWWEKVAH